MSKKPILYIKPTCPWCQEALDFFYEQDIALDVKDILAEPKYRTELQKVTGQTGVPAFVYGKFIVSDFDVDEFLQALEQSPEIKQALDL